MIKGKVIDITPYGQEYTTPQGQIHKAVAVGKCGVEVVINKSNKREKKTCWFIIHKRQSGVTFLIGNYSMGPVPNSEQSVADRREIVANTHSQQMQFNPYTVWFTFIRYMCTVAFFNSFVVC